ncbi:hypothetical protein GCM10007304_32780 [Rhodococcoides trifolii]|uniref:GAF domain-containing protein n=2 Tax=Rhodococcoides trifolii TaxID=908250 RepID=A0A917G0A8_9NOCA|nr:hypothetical protein GCM10007304_32780 [Rhodococcus trifolii]
MNTERTAVLLDARGAERVRAERDADAAYELRAKLDQRRDRAAELAALNDIAVRLTTVRDLNVLLQTVVDQARSLLRVDLSYVGTVDGDDFTVRVTSGALTPKLPGLTFDKNEGMAGLILREQAPAWTTDYQGEPAFRHMTGGDSAAAAENMRGLLGVPLQVGGQVLGALFACKRTERQFTESEVGLLSALAAHAAVAMDNARSFERYHQAVARLERANDELSTRTQQLETAIEWDRTLAGVVLDGGGVPRLIADVGRLMGKPVHLVTGTSTGPSDIGSVAQSIVQDFTNDSSLRDKQLEREGAGSLVVAQCIHTSDRVLGAVVVVTAENSPLGDADRILLGRVAPAVALLLAADQYAGESSRRSRDAFVVDLITRPASADDSDRQCRLAGVNPDRTYCVAVAETRDGGVDARRVLESASLPTGSVVAQHGSRAIAVVPTERPKHVLDSLPSSDTVTTVGVSAPARGAAALADAYLEAQQTCDVLATLGRPGDKSASSDLGIYGVLLSRTGRQELDALTRRLLGPMIDEEAKRGTPLIETLSTYLSQGRRHAQAATALNVHVNTLYQRLDSIDRLIGKQWREPDSALDLQVLLRLRRSGMLLAP